MGKRNVVTRRDFIRKFMDCGLTFDQACRCYTGMVSVFEDAVVRAEKIGIGRVGCLTPTICPPRDVVMGFQRGKGGKVVRTKRLYHLDERVKYRFTLYREFKTKHGLQGS